MKKFMVIALTVIVLLGTFCSCTDKKNSEYSNIVKAYKELNKNLKERYFQVKDSQMEIDETFVNFSVYFTDDYTKTIGDDVIKVVQDFYNDYFKVYKFESSIRLVDSNNETLRKIYSETDYTEFDEILWFKGSENLPELP